jgi:hypothetical protein
MRLGSGEELYAASRAGIMAEDMLSVVHDDDPVYAGIRLTSAWKRAHGP